MSKITWLSFRTFLYKGRIKDVENPHDEWECARKCEEVDEEIYQDFKKNMMRYLNEEDEMRKAIAKLDDYEKLIKQWKEEGKIK